VDHARLALTGSGVAALQSLFGASPSRLDYAHLSYHTTDVSFSDCYFPMHYWLFSACSVDYYAVLLAHFNLPFSINPRLRLPITVSSTPIPINYMPLRSCPFQVFLSVSTSPFNLSV